MEGEEEKSDNNNSSMSNADQVEKVSCVKYFDALWFCYSPVHQLQRYYVYGDVDDCVGHWSSLMDCLKQKTRFKDEERDARTHQGLWETRTPSEAAVFWEKEFSGRDAGHDDDILVPERNMQAK